jgi:hypothetical protein
MWFCNFRTGSKRFDRKVLNTGLVLTAKMTHNPASIVGLLYDARLGSATASELNQRQGVKSAILWSGIADLSGLES